MKSLGKSTAKLGATVAAFTVLPETVLVAGGAALVGRGIGEVVSYETGVSEKTKEEAYTVAGAEVTSGALIMAGTKTKIEIKSPFEREYIGESVSAIRKTTEPKYYTFKVMAEVQKKLRWFDIKYNWKKGRFEKVVEKPETYTGEALIKMTKEKGEMPKILDYEAWGYISRPEQKPKVTFIKGRGVLRTEEREQVLAPFITKPKGKVTTTVAESGEFLKEPTTYSITRKGEDYISSALTEKGKVRIGIKERVTVYDEAAEEKELVALRIKSVLSGKEQQDSIIKLAKPTDVKKYPGVDVKKGGIREIDISGVETKQVLKGKEQESLEGIASTVSAELISKAMPEETITVKGGLVVKPKMRTEQTQVQTKPDVKVDVSEPKVKMDFVPKVEEAPGVDVKVTQGQIITTIKKTKDATKEELKTMIDTTSDIGKEIKPDIDIDTGTETIQAKEIIIKPKIETKTKLEETFAPEITPITIKERVFDYGFKKTISPKVRMFEPPKRFAKSYKVFLLKKGKLIPSKYKEFFTKEEAMRFGARAALKSKRIKGFALRTETKLGSEVLRRRLKPFQKVRKSFEKRGSLFIEKEKKKKKWKWKI